MVKKVDLYAEIIGDAIGWVDQRLDAIRIESAFQKFMKQSKRWPTPADIIEAMPRRPEVAAITYTGGPKTREENIYAARAFLIIKDIFADRLTSKEANRLMTISQPFTDNYQRKAERQIDQGIDPGCEIGGTDQNVKDNKTIAAGSD